MLSHDLINLAGALATVRTPSGRLSLDTAAAAWLLVMLDALAHSAAALEGTAVPAGGRSPHLETAGEAGGRSPHLSSAGEAGGRLQTPPSRRLVLAVDNTAAGTAGGLSADLGSAGEVLP